MSFQNTGNQQQKILDVVGALVAQTSQRSMS